MPPDKKWSEAEAMVLDRLGRVETGLESLTNAVTSLRVEMAGMKVKAGVWGVIGSALPVLAAFIWFAIKGGAP